MRRFALLASALVLLLLAACANAPDAPRAPASAASAAAAATLAPNPNLVVQGIPPIPASLAQQVARYTDFRGHNFIEWHPVRREMLVSHRKAGGSTLQLFRINAPLAEPEPLTDFSEPVRVATW